MKLSSGTLQKLAIVQAGAAALALTIAGTRTASTVSYVETVAETPEPTPDTQPAPGRFLLEALSPEILPSVSPVEIMPTSEFRFPGPQLIILPYPLPRPSTAKEKCMFCGMG